MAKGTLDLNAKLPAGTYVYVGRRQLRHASEPNLKQEEMLEQAPQAFPHTFVDFSGVKIADALEHAGGKQGCVVDAQKVIRDKSEIGQVEKWRLAFDIELAVKTIASATNIEEEDQKRILEGGEPFVVLKFATAGAKLDIPLQPKDKLEAIKRDASMLYEAMLANLEGEEQLEKAEALYDQLQTMKL